MGFQDSAFALDSLASLETEMTNSLFFQDEQDLADLESYLSKAKRLDPEGLVKLRCFGDVLAVYVSPIFSGNLLGDGPTVIGLRTIRLAKPVELDSAFQMSALLDRLASDSLARSLELQLPPNSLRAAWTGITPPRDGWEQTGDIPQSLITQWAKDGIAEVAATLPESIGSAIAGKVRLQIWGKSVGLEFNFPAAVAFALAGLGFMKKEEQIAVFRARGWVRLSTQHGHVLSKESFRIS
jgi:hypothetical protein